MNDFSQGQWCVCVGGGDMCVCVCVCVCMSVQHPTNLEPDLAAINVDHKLESPAAHCCLDG